MAIDKVYGAEITIKVDKAKNKLNEVSNVAQSLGKKLQELNRFDVVGGQAINIFSNKIDTAGSKAKLLGNNFRLVKPAVQEATNEVEKLDNSVQKTSKRTNKIGEEISKSFNKGLKSVKRLTIGFLGARSAFGLFKKYMSEYSSQNEVFAQKMQLTTNVITNALAPAFEFFGNIIQYVVIGLAKVVELLFGVNILGKTVDNSLKGASKSAKELNENLSGLDEISNIDQSAGGLSTGIGGQLEALDEFQKKIKEVEEWFKKYKIDKFILGIKDAFKAVWDFASEHPILTTALVAGLLALKSNILPSLINLISGSGNASLLGGFKALVAVALTAWAVDQINKLDELEDKISKVTSELKSLSGKKEMWGNQTTAYMKEFNDYNKQDYQNAKKKLDSAIEDLEKAKKEQKKLVNAWTWVWDPAKYYNAKDEIKELDRRINRIKDEQQKLNVTYEIGTNQIGKSVDLTYTMQQNLEKANTRAQFVNDTTGKWKGNILSTNNEFGNFSQKINNTFGKNYQLNIKTNDKDIDNTKNKIKNTFSNPISVKFNGDTSLLDNAIKKSLNQISSVFKAVGIKLPSYDVGTDYVPRDQIAIVHEGERIIPKKYNNSQYIGNDETNSLLIELNKNVLELANKPTTLNVNGKELAKATYSDFQEENSRRGNNISVRRV